MSYLSHADLGGRNLAGPIKAEAEAEGEVFHAPWEPRVLALTLAMGATGSWNIDMSRAARETLPDYAELGYYEIWLRGLVELLKARSLVGEDELAAGSALHRAPAVQRLLLADRVGEVLAAGAPTQRATTAPAAFVVGQRVRARAGHAPHHTRLPGYVQGKAGVIERLHGMHVFADANAQGLGEQPEWLYTVVFDGAALWGDAAGAGVAVSVDAWQPYLEADP